MKIQDEYKELGEYGCYYFCLCDISNEYWENYKTGSKQVWFHEQDFIQTWRYCKQKGWIGKDCYIQDPCSILNYMTGAIWNVSWQNYDYENKKNDYVVEEWKWGLSTHFARYHQRKFSSIEVSRCINVGQITSKRVFTVK